MNTPTNEQINIAIAERCGWTEMTSAAGNKYWLTPDDRVWPEGVPDYCSDLNEMHEAENHLIDMQQPAYCAELVLLVGTTWMEALHATALQRAQALYHVITATAL